MWDGTTVEHDRCAAARGDYTAQRAVFHHAMAA